MTRLSLHDLDDMRSRINRIQDVADSIRKLYRCKTDSQFVAAEAEMRTAASRIIPAVDTQPNQE